MRFHPLYISGSKARRKDRQPDVTCQCAVQSHGWEYGSHIWNCTTCTTLNIYNQFRIPPDRHPQLVLQGWRLRGWLLGGSPYSSRRHAGHGSEHTPHASENTRCAAAGSCGSRSERLRLETRRSATKKSFSIGCKLACARMCPAMPFDTICAIQGSAAEHSRLGLTRPVCDINDLLKSFFSGFDFAKG